MNILVTGVAGFIGSYVAKRLLDAGYVVVGIDNLNEYYDVQLKKDRLKNLQTQSGFIFFQEDIVNKAALVDIFERIPIAVVIHLAAQAGVRYSLENPDIYISSNIQGFYHVLELSRRYRVEHFIFSSSSSVYGANTTQPFTEADRTDHPLALYAATKKANEVMAHSYASAFNLPCTGLRFFTVYGPWGRPDMALFKFTHHLLHDQVIEVYNDGDMARDFTYIDDIVDAVMLTLKHPATPHLGWSGDDPDTATSYAPFRLYNVGNGQPVPLMAFIEAIETALGKKAQKKMLPLQQGDVTQTHADISRIAQDMGFKPKISITEGVERFVRWYCDYYRK